MDESNITIYLSVCYNYKIKKIEKIIVNFFAGNFFCCNFATSMKRNFFKYWRWQGLRFENRKSDGVFLEANV